MLTALIKPSMLGEKMTARASWVFCVFVDEGMLEKTMKRMDIIPLSTGYNEIIVAAYVIIFNY